MTYDERRREQRKEAILRIGDWLRDCAEKGNKDGFFSDALLLMEQISVMKDALIDLMEEFSDVQDQSDLKLDAIRHGLSALNMSQDDIHKYLTGEYQHGTR